MTRLPQNTTSFTSLQNPSELCIVPEGRAYNAYDRVTPLFDSLYGQEPGSYQGTPVEEAVWASGSGGIVDSPSSYSCLSQYVCPRPHSHYGLAHTLVGPGYLGTPSLRSAITIRRRCRI